MTEFTSRSKLPALVPQIGFRFRWSVHGSSSRQGTEGRQSAQCRRALAVIFYALFTNRASPRATLFNRGTTTQSACREKVMGLDGKQ